MEEHLRNLANGNDENVYAKLETMVASIRQEASSLETLKRNLAEFSQLKIRATELESRLREADEKISDQERTLSSFERSESQMRTDFQKLNDTYNIERREHMESKNMNISIEAKLDKAESQLCHLQRELLKFADVEKKRSALSDRVVEVEAELASVSASHAQQRSNFDAAVAKTESEKNSLLSDLAKASDEMHKQLATLKLRDKEILTLQKHARKYVVEKERQMMYTEDLVGFIDKISAEANQINDEVIMHKQITASVNREHQDVLKELSTSFNTIHELETKISLLERRNAECENAFEGSRQAAEATIERLQEQHNEVTESEQRLKERNEFIERMSSEIQLQSKESIDALSSDLESSRQELLVFKKARVAKETEVEQQLARLEAEKEEAVLQMNAAITQLDALQVHVREVEKRHWDDIQSIKDLEARALADCAVVKRKLEEATTKYFEEIQTRQDKEDRLMKDAASSSGIIAVLTGELEKRINELTQIRDERDVLLQEKSSISDRLTNVSEELSKTELMYRKLIEDDRGRMQKEMKAVVTKLKTVETEKHDLLKETAVLMEEVSQAKLQLTNSLHESESTRGRMVALEIELNEVKANRDRLDDDRATLLRRDEEFKLQLQQVEGKIIEEKQRCQNAIKESARVAHQQVNELSTQLKASMSEIDGLKHKQTEAANAEKNAWAQVDKLRKERDIIFRSQEELKQHMHDEVANLRRDFSGTKGRLKETEDAKCQLEITLHENRLELGRHRNDVERLSDSLKVTEQRLAQYSNQCEALKAETDAIRAENGQCKTKIMELEDIINKKQRQLEKGKRDLLALEQDTAEEMKRLEDMLNASEHDAAEYKSMIDINNKELTEAKLGLQKMQQASSANTSRLLEELRATEDARAAERKAHRTEIEGYHYQLSELQNTLARTRESADELVTRSRNEKSDKDLRLSQLEGELDRSRALCSTREARIDELEKLRQSDRASAMELREQLSAAERALVESRIHTQRRGTDYDVAQKQLRRSNSNTDAITASTQLKVSPQSARSAGPAFEYSEDEFSPAHPVDPRTLGLGHIRSMRLLSDHRNGDEDNEGSLEDDHSGSFSLSRAPQHVSPAADRVTAALAARVKMKTEAPVPPALRGMRHTETGGRGEAEHTYEDSPSSLDVSIYRGPSTSVAASIQRTQDFLQKRLTTGRDLATSSSACAAAPGSARSQQVRLEAVVDSVLEGAVSTKLPRSARGRAGAEGGQPGGRVTGEREVSGGAATDDAIDNPLAFLPRIRAGVRADRSGK